MFVKKLIGKVRSSLTAFAASSNVKDMLTDAEHTGKDRLELTDEQAKQFTEMQMEEAEAAGAFAGPDAVPHFDQIHDAQGVLNSVREPAGAFVMGGKGETKRGKVDLNAMLAIKSMLFQAAIDSAGRQRALWYNVWDENRTLNTRIDFNFVPNPRMTVVEFNLDKQFADSVIEAKVGYHQIPIFGFALTQNFAPFVFGKWRSADRMQEFGVHVHDLETYQLLYCRHFGTPFLKQRLSFASMFEYNPTAGKSNTLVGLAYNCDTQIGQTHYRALLAPSAYFLPKIVVNYDQGIGIGKFSASALLDYGKHVYKFGLGLAFGLNTQ